MLGSIKFLQPYFNLISSSIFFFHAEPTRDERVVDINAEFLLAHVDDADLLTLTKSRTPYTEKRNVPRAPPMSEARQGVDHNHGFRGTRREQPSATR